MTGKSTCFHARNSSNFLVPFDSKFLLGFGYNCTSSCKSIYSRFSFGFYQTTIRYPRIHRMESLITRDPYVHFSCLIVKPLLVAVDKHSAVDRRRFVESVSTEVSFQAGQLP